MAVTTSRLEDVANAAAESASETAKAMGNAAERLRSDFGDTDRRVRELVDEYPFTCFIGAVVVGYLLGRIATRI